MLDAKGKTKILTSEAAEKSVSVDPQHRITIDDAKSKGLPGESGSSKKPPRPGIVITHRQQQEGRHQERWHRRKDRYQQQQEERRREEWHRHKDHWRCPFFIHCWEEVIKLTTVENCPECNGYYRANRLERRFQPGNQGLSINEPIRGRASVHDRLGARLNVHERLGKRARYFPRNQEEIEEMANARVPDEEIFYRDPNIRRVESTEICYQSVLKTKLPRWCPEGVTKT
jgi:hypothetical protein